MGAEATCTVSFNRSSHSGRARLEATALHVRAGGLKLNLPFAEMSEVVARAGTLTIKRASDTLMLALGPAAQKWADKILHPPSRVVKIGVKPGWRVSVVGPIETAFLLDMQSEGATVARRLFDGADAIFFGLTAPSDLDRIAALKAALKPNGAVWLVRPKGHAELTERRVMAAGKSAGLVDVKVVAFSPTHTAEKFVIPVAKRRLKRAARGEPPSRLKSS
jgi:hypothetical protein